MYSTYIHYSDIYDVILFCLSGILFVWVYIICCLRIKWTLTLLAMEYMNKYNSDCHSFPRYFVVYCDQTVNRPKRNSLPQNVWTPLLISESRISCSFCLLPPESDCWLLRWWDPAHRHRGQAWVQMSQLEGQEKGQHWYRDSWPAAGEQASWWDRLQHQQVNWPHVIFCLFALNTYTATLKAFGL